MKLLRLFAEAKRFFQRNEIVERDSDTAGQKSGPQPLRGRSGLRPVTSSEAIREAWKRAALRRDATVKSRALVRAAVSVIAVSVTGLILPGS